MSVNAKSLEPGSANPYLEQVSGDGRGRTYELSGERLSIGRSDNNDVVIVSEAVSRFHAILERQEDGSLVIRDNQSKNGVLINGSSVPVGHLADGDIVQIGNFVFRFHLPAAKTGEEGSYHAEINEAAYGKEVEIPKAAAPRSKRLLIYGLVVLGLVAAYYISQSDSKPTATDVKGEDSGASIPGTESAKTKLTAPNLEVPKEKGTAQTEDPALSKVEQTLDKMDLNNSSIRESESYFRKGQREYLNGNYHRAMEEFRAATSIYRNHELAQYYLKLSIYQVELEAKKNMEMGQTYFESMQYARAMFHFKQVVLMMEHRPADPMVGMAEKYISQCERRLQAAEQFP